MLLVSTGTSNIGTTFLTHRLEPNDGHQVTKSQHPRPKHASPRQLDERTAQFDCVEVSASWQVDIFVEFGLHEAVRGIRLAIAITNSVDDVDDPISKAKLCKKLSLLTHVTKLDFNRHWLGDLSLLAHIPRLRELDLGQTPVSTLSDLIALRHLESLAIRVALTYDLSGLTEMHKLKNLRIYPSYPWGEKIRVPSLAALTKLHRLELHTCIIDSADDLLDMSTTLDYLELTRVDVRKREPTSDEESQARCLQPDEWAHNFAQLKSVSLSSTLAHLSSCTLRRGTGLDVISVAIDQLGNLGMLASLPSIECVRLTLPLAEPSEDFSLLRRLPSLSHLGISQATFGFSEQDRQNQQQVLKKVLAQLTGLQHLEINGEINTVLTLSELSKLESLVLGSKCQFTTFDWIQPLRHLRSLTIKEMPCGCDPSGIGNLVGLVELTIRGRDWKCDDESQMNFLGNLVNLKTLELDVQNFHNLSALRGMRHLKTLRVITSSDIDVLKKNADVLASCAQLRTLEVSMTSLVAPASGI